MNKEIKVNEKVYTIRELLNKEVKDFPQILDTDTDEVKKQKNDEAIKKEILLCTGITEEDFNNLTRKEYLTIRLAILKLNTPEPNFWEAGCPKETKQI